MKSALTIFFVFLMCISAKSQINSKMLTSQNTFSMFRDPSYISFAGGIGNIENLVFEADIIPYYLVSLSNSDRWGIELSPRVILRMYNQESFPVRTPSFMPKVTSFYQIKESSNNKSDLFGYFTWCHHSNGQDESFYGIDSVSINTKSGNFATNYIELGLFKSQHDKRIPDAIQYFKFSAQYHYKHIEELDGRFGDWRFFIDHQANFKVSNALRALGLTKRELPAKSSVVNLSMKLGFIAGKMNNYSTLNLHRLISQLTASYKPAFLQDVTLFAQYYYGQDYYNIYFDRQLHVFRIGISAKPNFINYN